MSKKKLTKAQKLAKRLRKKRIKSFFLFLLCVLILSGVAWGVRFFLFETAKIKTEALSPKYRAGDVVVINKLMDISEIQRGDLVYASFSAASDKRLIRQVAGMKDDEIILRDDGNKYLVPADASAEINLGPAEGLAGGTLQEGQYLLLATNLDDTNALDSRQLGLVTSVSFIGTPGKVLWPLGRALK